MRLTAQGVYLPTEGIPAAELRGNARAIEELGYGAVWLPDDLGRDPMVASAIMLEHTQALTVATGVLNLYGRDPMATAMAQQTLSELSAGRFLLGLGVSDSAGVESRGHRWRPPLQAIRAYLAALRQAHTGLSVTRSLRLEGFAPQTVGHGAHGVITTGAGELPIVLGALGPKMTALAGEIAQGVLGLDSSPEEVRRQRQLLGAEAWLCTVQRVCLTHDARRARQLGRQVFAGALDLPERRHQLTRLGFCPQDFEYGGSDALIDHLLRWGDLASLRERIDALLEAGANQVCVQALRLDDPVRPCLRTLEALRN